MNGMSSKTKQQIHKTPGHLVEVKSKFDAEFRRFSLDKNKNTKFEEFLKFLTNLHKLSDVSFVLTYTDVHGDLLPINNEDNFRKALYSGVPLLRILIQRKGESWEEINGYGNLQKKKGFISQVLAGTTPSKGHHGGHHHPRIAISLPEDFRQVSSIIDVDIVPETCRRVRLLKHGSDKPLGFYIRDGTSVRVTHQGLEKAPGIFISRLVPGGLAESTGLLAVNDEVLEVNGIEVAGKSLDQVTDMMVANSANLIITVRPANQRNFVLVSPSSTRGSFGHASQASEGSHQSQASVISDEDKYDQDEIRDLTGITLEEVTPPPEEEIILEEEKKNGTGEENGEEEQDDKRDDEGVVTL